MPHMLPSAAHSARALGNETAAILYQAKTYQSVVTRSPATSKLTSGGSWPARRRENLEWRIASVEAGIRSICMLLELPDVPCPMSYVLWSAKTIYPRICKSTLCFVDVIMKSNEIDCM